VIDRHDSSERYNGALGGCVGGDVALVAMACTADMLTTDPPPPLIMCGITCFDSRKMVLRLAAMTRSQSASGMLTTVPWISSPVQLRRPVTRPRAAAAVATRTQSSSRVRSPATAWICRDGRVARPSALRSVATTVAPQSAKCEADARPMPEAAPLTTTTPESLFIAPSSLLPTVAPRRPTPGRS
jgi:hypothetical protein